LYEESRAQTVKAFIHPPGTKASTFPLLFPAAITLIVPFDFAYVTALHIISDSEGVPPHPRLRLITLIPLSAAYLIHLEIP
jgi:hypothetical protein